LFKNNQTPEAIYELKFIKRRFVNILSGSQMGNELENQSRVGIILK